MMVTYQLREKIQEIILELKQQQLWKKQMPAWVTNFSNKEIINQEDFAGWLQFVLLPNLQQEHDATWTTINNYIAPQAVKFFGDDIRKGKLLQLLIELDSLS